MASIVEGNLVGAKKIELFKSTEIAKLNLPSVNSISFSPDGTKLLSCNHQGKILCWDVTNFGEDFSLLTSIRISERGVLCSSCKYKDTLDKMIRDEL